MADGTVRGAFDLEAEQPIRTLTAIRDRGREADAAMGSLGRRMDSTARKAATSWASVSSTVDRESTKIEARLDRLEVKLRQVGSVNATPTVELNGFDRVNAQLSEIELRLDRLNRQRATPRVGLGGGFANGTGGGGTGNYVGGTGGRDRGSATAFQAVGGIPTFALAALGLSPGIQGLLGGATSLVGSAGSAALGAGTVGLGGLASLGVGGGLSALAIKPAITGLQTVTKAQQAYTKAVQEFGRTSAQAATAQRGLNQAIVANPAAAGASRQLALLRSEWQTAGAGARTQAYRGISGVLYNARQAAPTIGRFATTATGATSNAAIAYSGFLTQTPQLNMLGQLTRSFATELPTAERSLENITTTMGHLAVASIPFFHEANVWVENWTHGLATSTGETTRVQAKMQGYVDSAKDWARLTGAAYRTIRDIFSAGTPQGDSMVKDLTATFDRWDAWINRNPEKVNAFFNRAENTTVNIAHAVSSLVHDISQLATFLDPIFNRAMQFISFVSGMGPGGAGVLGSVLYGAYGGLRGASGGRLPSGGALASTFVTGSAGPGLMRSRGAGGTLVGGATYTSALDRASNYDVAVGRTRSGTFLMGPATVGPAGAIARRGGFGAAQEGGVLSGLLVRSPTAARAADALGSLRGFAGAAAAGAARFALPVLGITSLLQAAQTPGSIGTKLDAGAASALSLASLGLISPSRGGTLGQMGLGALSGLAAGPLAPFAMVGGALLAHAPNAGATLTAVDPSLRTLSQQAGSVRSISQMQALLTRVPTAAGGTQSVIGATAEMSPQDAAKVTAALTRVTQVAAQNAGVGSASTWANAFTTALDRGVKPQRAVATMMKGMDAQILELGPTGSKAFARSTAQWVSQLEADNPKLRKPLDKMMNHMVDDMNNANHTVGTSMKDLQDKIFYFNGQILTGSQTTWGQIKDALVNPATVAQEKLLGIFGQIQSEAVNALTQMGFSRAQATAIVTDAAKGGQAGKAASLSVGLRQSGGAATAPLSPTAPGNLKKHERGGVFGGSGLLDTVATPGGMVAPGEAWIANRHTMNRLSSSTLAREGKTAWEIIRDETRPHSAPLQDARMPREGIMPGFALGGLFGNVAGAISGVGANIGNVTGAQGPGNIGNLPAMVQTANWITGRHYPYSWGGGHNSSFSGPYDCSGAVSAVLHAGGVLGSPETSGQMMSFGLPGPGEVTLYANPGHVYMSMAGHYFGTSTMNPGGGAAWFQGSPRPGFVQRHVPVVGSAAGIGGPGSRGALGAQSISLRAPRSGLAGIPGALADQGSRIFAGGLQRKLNQRLGAMTGGAISGAGWTGGGSAAANQALGHRMMLAAGWGENQWPSLLALWNQESGWNANAVNPSSGAMGIPQALGHGNVFPLGQPAPQIAWGLNYIRGRYGSPAAAEAHEQSFNWYQRGGQVNWAGWHGKGGTFTTKGPTLFGAGEVPGRHERVTVTPAHTPTGRARQIIVHMEHVHLGSGSHDELKRVAEDVAGHILDALDNTGVGGSDADLIGAGS